MQSPHLPTVKPYQMGRVDLAGSDDHHLTLLGAIPPMFDTYIHDTFRDDQNGCRLVRMGDEVVAVSGVKKHRAWNIGNAPADSDWISQIAQRHFPVRYVLSHATLAFYRGQTSCTELRASDFISWMRRYNITPKWLASNAARYHPSFRLELHIEFRARIYLEEPLTLAHGARRAAHRPEIERDGFGSRDVD
jgi:hypothetical protein